MFVKPTATIAALTMLGAGALVAASQTAASAAADAGIERRGVCGQSAVYDAEVDREDGGLEVNFDLDRAASGERWRIVLDQNGEGFFNEVRTVDREGEIDVEIQRPDRSGTDEFRMQATRMSGEGNCAVTIRY